jgi:hypothetical protein
MNRIVLAMLALLTGLATQLSPAQARMGVADTEIGALAGSSVRQERAVAAIAVCAPIQRIAAGVERCALPPITAAPRAPTVLMGIDRARE